MVLRNIIKIDEEKCNGCGDCVNACAEGAIEIIDGKAKLVSEVYCDGLGACIGHCPQDAITIETREANEFDEEVTKAYLAKKKSPEEQTNFVCPGMVAKKIREKNLTTESVQTTEVVSQLSHWPVQLKLVSPQAPYFDDADLLLVADCVPFAMGDFHNRFLKDHSVIIGCPKLDDADYYVEKLAQILKANKLKSLTVIHMEVPCCSGLTEIAKRAIAMANIDLPFIDFTINLQGSISETNLIRTQGIRS